MDYTVHGVAKSQTPLSDFDFDFSLFLWGFPGGTSDNEPACQSGDVRRQGSIPRFGRSPGGGQGNPLQCSCLDNPIDKGAWGATVHGVTQSLIRLK